MRRVLVALLVMAGSSVASPAYAAPTQVGAFFLQPRPLFPKNLPESDNAWNCFVDGDKSCGPGWTNAKYLGFNYGPLCIQYPSDKRYVFCSDGKTYKAGW